MLSPELERALMVALLTGTLGLEQVPADEKRNPDLSRVGKQVYEVVKFLHDGGSAAPYDDDAITLAAQHLDGRIQVGEVQEYLAALPDEVPKEIFLILEQANVRKGLVKMANLVSTQLASNTYDRSSFDKVLDGIQYVTKRVVALGSDVDVETYVAIDDNLPTWPTGIGVIDAQIVGLRQGELAMVAAAPKTGKTTFLCVVPESRVLTSDLRWVAAGSLQVGDSLLAAKETGSRRGFQHSVVLQTVRQSTECWRVVTDRGEIICAAWHPLLSPAYGGSGQVLRWIKVRDLKLGYLLKWITAPWSEDVSFEAGYLSGCYDGEGYLYSKQTGMILGLVQSRKNQIVLTEMERVLGRYASFSTSEEPAHVRLGISNYSSIMRVLGSVRPRRLLKKFIENIEGRKLPQTYAKVLSIEPVGRREVVSLTTSSGTYISEGFVSHNCGQAAVALRRGAKVLYVTVQDIAGPGIARWVRQIGGPEIFAGKLYVADLTDKVASLMDIEASVSEIPGGPDVLIVDRAEELSSYRDSDHVRFEYRRIYTALRGLARRKKLACWTDAQVGVVYDETNIGFAALAEEKTGRAAILDLFFGMHRDGNHLTISLRGRRQIDEPVVQCLLLPDRKIVSL